MNKHEFKSYLQALCPWVDDVTLTKIEQYKQLLQDYNKQTNITRLASDELFYDQYFLASLIPFTKLSYFQQNIDFKLLDIGTGSGIPGIVLKLIYPKLRLTLIESNNKKCIFLNLLLQHLQLTDVIVVNQRCEECVDSYREYFDIVTSRAVSSLNKILELSAAFTKVDGHIISLKSQNYLVELNEATNAISILHLELKEIINYEFAEHTHVVLDFLKNYYTEKIYPRSWKKIMDKPL